MTCTVPKGIPGLAEPLNYAFHCGTIHLSVKSCGFSVPLSEGIIIETTSGSDLFKCYFWFLYKNMFRSAG